jgi:putative ABC transport system permease protein
VTPPRGSLIERVLRRLVRLLPADFRSDFGGAIEADLAERRRDGDRSGLLRRDVPSLAFAVVREHAASLRQDAQYALRMMRRTPGFTALAVLMLALGTGVNAAVFSVVDAVMLRSPFTDPDQIAIVLRYDDQGRRTAAFEVQAYTALASAPGPFAAIAALSSGEHIVTGRGDPERIDLECVSAAMFDVLGTPPQTGRGLVAADDRPGAAPVMVLSHPYWRQLGSPPDVVGSSITVNQTAVTIVGVMPDGFAGPFERSDTAAWTPISRPIAGGGSDGCGPIDLGFVNVFARVRPGLTIAAAQTGLDRVALISLTEQNVYEVRTPFMILIAAVACVLLIACFNVGGLQMERALARRREMALRLALGAGRGRLIRQALTENVVLALVGAAAGLAATSFAMRAILALLPTTLPRLDRVGLNGRVLVVTLVVAAAAGIVAGLLPLGQTMRLDPARDLGAAGRSTERRHNWLRRGLVVVEIALSVVVLIGAGLMIQSFLTLRPVNPGFDPAGKMSIGIRLPGATPQASETFLAQVLTRLDSAPDVRAAAGTTYLPMRGNTQTRQITFDDDTTASVNTNKVTPGYFDLMKIPLRAGRDVAGSDTLSTPLVAVVNEALARRIDPAGRVIGRRLGIRWRPRDPPEQREIIGVIEDTRFIQSHLRASPEAYVPFAQQPVPAFRVVVAAAAGREAEADAALRDAVRAVDPSIVVGEVERMPAVLERGMRRWRFGAWLLGVFAGLAVTLAAIGLMTTVGWWVRQRTRELGVRVALGASRRQVTRLVLRQGLALAAAGIVAGCAAAAGLTRFLESWIYGVTPLDPSTFVACAAGMLVIAAGAVFLPARRATSADPVVALRAE